MKKRVLCLHDDGRWRRKIHRKLGYREKPILNDGHISQERLGDLSGVVAIDLQQLRGGEKIRSGGSAFEGKGRELD